MKIIERSIQEIGKSLLVTLPRGWARSLKLKKGSMLRMAISDQGVLTVTPEFNAPAEHQEVTLPFDEFFSRRFYREYFHGNEKITFTLERGAGEAERKRLSALLSKFMNVQVIEESATKIVVKCFRIEELSIEECLRRMHFLGLNMLDELIAGGERGKRAEMDESLTRFYYMLVMQIRRYLTEGKFTEQNQISLTRAMDFRMVAEKVERIAALAKAQEHAGDLAQWNEIKEYYSRSFSVFLNREFEKAMKLASEHPLLLKRYQGLLEKAAQRKDVRGYGRLRDMITILWYCRDIHMLVR